ncbi:DUF6527 family protein [Flavobacterium oreochromis]|uniref:DUF6527 family protein n=1 Tax=Flavobacterium oreochromis TaxID=2906078 RepID=UPI00385A24E1
MLRRIFDWLTSFFIKEKPKIYEDESYSFEFVDDVPDNPKDKVLYLIGEDGYFWQFVVVCPCGCKSLLYMNLMDDEAPFWKYDINDGLISITPSIDRKVGCKSHFFIKKGIIIWA